jgi:hypothetical protein
VAQAESVPTSRATETRCTVRIIAGSLGIGFDAPPQTPEERLYSVRRACCGRAGPRQSAGMAALTG